MASIRPFRNSRVREVRYGLPMSKIKTEKGSGGSRRHGGKDNRLAHQEEKDLGRRHRRLEDKAVEREAARDDEE